MGNSGSSFGTRHQARLANRFGLLVVMFMLSSAVFSVAGDPSPVVVAQQECPEGEVMNDATGACEAAGEVAPPDCADGEALNPFTGVCEPAVDAAPPDCAEDEARNEDTGECLPIVEVPQSDCAEDEVLNEDTGACEPAVGVAQPDCAEDEVLNEDTGACGPMDDTTDAGMVEISKFECPSGFTGENSNSDDFASMCTEAMSSVVFEAYDSAGIVGGGATDAGGRLQVGELPLGQVSIVEAIPDGYGAPFVFCASGDDPASLGGFEGYDVTDGYYATIDFGSAAYYACSWYNIPEDDGGIPEEDGGITITKYDCPEGYVPPDGQVSGLLANCVDRQDGVVFDLSNDDGYAAGGETGAEAAGTLSFNGLQPGSYTLTEQVPDGYGTPSVLCGYPQDPNDDGPLNMTVAAAAGGVWNLEYDRPGRLSCEWFNIPSPDSGINISKWLCPVGYDPTVVPYETLLEDCGQAYDGAEFTLGNGQETYDSGMSGDDGPGRLRFEEYQPGAVVITETIPEGYGTPGVYCWFDLGDEAPVGNEISVLGGIQIMDVAADGSISTQIGANQHYVCNWFNFPSSDYDIVISKYVCPAGYAPEAFGYGELLADCTGETRDGVVFHVGEQTQATGEVIPGGVAFDGYEPGDLVIREEVPAGYTPYVFCGQSSGGVALDQMTPVPMLLTLTEDGSITVNLPENSRLVCYWYNVPSGDSGIDQDEPTGSIDIFKRLCSSPLPGGIDNDSLAAAFISTCTEPMSGVAFEAYDDQGAFVGGGATDAGGYLNIRELPLGRVSIFELDYASYGRPAVFCFDDSRGEYGQWAFAPDVSIPIDFNEANYYSCYWFTIPTETAVPGSTPDVVDEEEEPGFIAGLSLQHFACDPGLDPRLNQGRWTLLQLCTGAGKPAFVYHVYVDQTLIETVGLQTAANTWGEVFLPAGQQEPIPAGLVTIMVEPPAGYAGARVNCLLSRTDDSSEEFEPNLINETSILVNVGPGESLVCEWFNAPVDPGIDISAWICPPGYTATAANNMGYAVLLQTCAQPHAGVEFSLGLDLSIDDMGAYAFGFTGGDGRLRFDDYNPGALVIAETIPEGYGTPLAYCSFDYDPSSGIRNSTGFDGSIRPDGGIPENSHLTCDFFNFPQDELTGSIDLFRFECPPGFRPNPFAVNEAMSMCSEPVGGVTFEISDEQGVVGGGSTDSAGYLNIRELPLGGRLSIADLDTDGYDGSVEDVDGLPYVFCFDDSVVYYPGPDLPSVRGAYSQHFIVADEFMTVQIDLNNVSNYSSCLWFSIAGD